jgi:ribosomal protein S18 acetylase RimI-like enzyme
VDKLKDSGFIMAVIWVLKENQNAIGFYEQQGFVHDGTERIINSGRNLIQVRYLRKLHEI